MSLLAFINKNTFEIKDELDDYIYCDYEIKDIIATLNKKGYKTQYSCAGHNEVGLCWPLHMEEIDKLEEYLKKSEEDKTLHFIKKDDKYFYHKDEKTNAYIYISFCDNYEFEYIPEGFKYELVEGKSYISKKVSFYEEENHIIRKNDEIIYKELEIAREELLKWSNSL